MYCPECNRKLSKSGKCSSCSRKGSNNPNYKDGVTNRIIKHICNFCNKEFSVVGIVDKKFCSRDCFSSYLKTYRLGANNPAYIDGRNSRFPVCSTCGKSLKDLKATICKSCKAKRQHTLGQLKGGQMLGKKHPPEVRARMGRRGESSPRWKGGVSSIFPKCVDCGKQLKGHFTRCLSCSNKGERSPRWLGGKSFEEYSTAWTSELRNSIRNRDNYRCSVCWLTEDENRRLYRYGLIVHHIDYNKKNCVPSNLITLCHSCHSKTNGTRSYWQDYFQKKMIDRGILK